MTPRKRVEKVLFGGHADIVPFTTYESKIPQCAKERELRNRGLCIVKRDIPVFKTHRPNVTVKEEGEEVGTLAVSPKEYVVDSHTMSALGNGNPDEGADIMDEFVETIREETFGTREQPNEIDGLASLQSMLERV